MIAELSFDLSTWSRSWTNHWAVKLLFEMIDHAEATNTKTIKAVSSRWRHKTLMVLHRSAPLRRGKDGWNGSFFMFTCWFWPQYGWQVGRRTHWTPSTYVSVTNHRFLSYVSTPMALRLMTLHNSSSIKHFLWKIVRNNSNLRSYRTIIPNESEVCMDIYTRMLIFIYLQRTSKP